ncbi:MAG: putative quinol monooxygenase [Alphaproteobacteria bacterium]|nr:putative quinol monooxygenase [Alphaproteobacteria bacterium]
MAVTVILEVKAKAGTGDDLLATFREIFPETRGYDGCIALDTYRNQDDPDVIVLIEKWRSRGQYEKYLGWRQDSGTFGRVAEGFAGAPSIRYFDLTDV